MQVSVSSQSSVFLGLNAVLFAVTNEQPRILTLKRSERDLLMGGTVTPEDDVQHLKRRDALPFGLLDPVGDRTLELGVRERVYEQTGLDLGYVEQLYTFGDNNRLGLNESERPRVISVAYVGLGREEPTQREDAIWRDCYTFLPWEDWRKGRPLMLENAVFPALEQWIRLSKSRAQKDERKDRAAVTFGLGTERWDEERVLERYELLYELGLVTERSRDEARGVPAATQASEPLPLVRSLSLESEQFGRPMALDHRRILSTALGRLRGKIKYRPVVFELLPDTFTLLRLQRVVEALSGVPLHKQNFRRLVEKGGLVEGTNQVDSQTGGRPAALFAFRREVIRERLSPGVGLPGASQRTKKKSS